MGVSLGRIKFKVHYWPTLTFIWFVVTFVISYAVALYHDHIYWLFPYISDTGDLAPESCVFAQFLNIGIIFLSVTVYVRYREVDAVINGGLINSPATTKLNIVGLCLGWLKCLGLSLVANFQLNADYVSKLHIYAAMVAFLIGAVYCILQTVISWKYVILYRNATTGTSKLAFSMFSFRVFLVVSFFAAFISYKVCAYKAAALYDAKAVYKQNAQGELVLVLPRQYTPDIGGFKYKVASAFSQWIVVLIELLYIATFTKEFRNMRFREIRFESKYSQI
ncbi:DNA damage-regulated autophagy modulator protein 1-like [Agrilus planipennis]|nr:DNA damage-regulated autophagy modulator protein 1-like [Agrilus planipennis]